MFYTPGNLFQLKEMSQLFTDLMSINQSSERKSGARATTQLRSYTTTLSRPVPAARVNFVIDDK